jgi:hypothetical protein
MIQNARRLPSMAITDVRISRMLVLYGCVGCMCLFGGCTGPEHARYPTAMTWFPYAENSAYERQDPFPDPDIGPSTDCAPRGYERPRSTPRRAAEQRLLQGLPVGPESVPPGPPRSSLRRPRAVY